MKPLLTLAGVAAVTALAAPVLAQNYNRPATVGDVSLAAGFQPDPYQVAVPVRRDSSINANTTAAWCNGWVENAPHVQLTYEAGTYPLIISVQSSHDTVLLINGPDAQWHCDDDGAGNFNPRVRFDQPESGVYDIWVGTYESGGAPIIGGFPQPHIPAQLSISEIE